LERKDGDRIAEMRGECPEAEALHERKKCKDDRKETEKGA